MKLFFQSTIFDPRSSILNPRSSILDPLSSLHDLRPAPARAISFINALVLGPEGVLGTSLRIEAGRFGAIDLAPRAGDLVLDLDGAVISPGLINAHDHLELNNFGRLKWRERYANVRDWIADFRPRFKTDPALIGPRSVALGARLLMGGVKNVLSGVTTVCHHNPLYWQLRFAFPIRVVRRYRWSHSLLLDGEAVAQEYRRTPKHWPWIIHLAEGTDAEATAELERLDRLGCLSANTVIVHGVGLGPNGRSKVIEKGAGLIWCPSSNCFLLGAAAPVQELVAAGRVALGSDSRLSGEIDLLDELRFAHATQQVSTSALFRMVTSDAATILRLSDAGRLAEGLPADVTIFSRCGGEPFDSIAASRRSGLRLVMVSGRPLVADPDLAAVFVATRVTAMKVCLDGREKLLAAPLVTRIRRLDIHEPGLEI